MILKKRKKSLIAQSACDETTIIYSVINSKKKEDKFTFYSKQKLNQSHNF